MKTLLVILAVVTCLTACQTADRKTTGTELSAEEKRKVLNDSANYTSIEWLDPVVQDLGKIKEGQVVVISYRFKNTGNKQLVIADVSPGCGCTVPEKNLQPIAPGHEDVIKANFNSKGQHKGENTKYIMVTSNTTPSQVQLSFRVEITD
jgi:Protein of unknown function (DUF1573)